MEEKLLNKRFRTFLAIVICTLMVIGARLWHLQILQGEYYSRLAEGNRMRQIRVSPARGVIYDRFGDPLVDSRRSFTVSLVPEGVTRDSNTLKMLGDILGMDDDALDEAIRLGRGFPYEPVRIARDVDASTVFAIEENRRLMPGVFIQEEPVREYWETETISHIIGYLGVISPSELQTYGSNYRGWDLVGKSGLERLYEQELRGQDGTLTVEVNALSRPISTVSSFEAIPGNNLVLAIDPKLQRVATEAFLEHTAILREEFPNAKNGAVVAMQPQTGEILAMVSIPQFDPARLLTDADRSDYYQRLTQDPNLPFFNRVTQGQYGPGSAFKPFVAVAMLEEGVFGADQIFDATGTSEYGVRDWVVTRGGAPFGEITLNEALAMSSNHYFAEHGVSLGIDRMAPWLREFGFGSPTGLELHPRESMGLVPDRQWKKEYFVSRPTYDQVWYPTDTEQISIGQGFVNVTPIQLALGYSGIANRGTIYNPILVKAVLGPDGEEISRVEPEVAREIQASARTWEKVIAGMEAVITHPRGTARSAFGDFPLSIAGKTGSYEIPGKDANGLFGAFAPSDDPELVVIVIVEHGGGGGAGAAPIARKVFDAYFELENPPD